MTLLNAPSFVTLAGKPLPPISRAS